LIAAGRVSRTPDDEDGRIGHLTLTRTGRAVYDQIAPLALELEERFLQALTPAERKNFDQLLTKLSLRTRSLSDGQ
jgi:DNA-binding MarR family transcriptional regulator